MRNNNSKRIGDGGAMVPRFGRHNNGIIPSSFRTLSGYLRIVSSGASTVASSVRSAASAIVERDGETGHDQVSWAGFDKLEVGGGITRQVLLLGFSYGFQIWDVEVAGDVRNLESRHDGPVSFMQMLPEPVVSDHSGDKFAESRPLLVICADGSFSGGINAQEASGIPCNGSVQQSQGSVNNRYMPTAVWFYSLRSQSYVHLLRFRSAVIVVRCSSRIVAVLQSAQIHCLSAATLEKEYTILTNPLPAGCYGSGDVGLGPLAVGPRWMAYSGSQVTVSNSGRVIPQHLNSSPSLPCTASNGSLVVHYAKESSKHLAAGIVTLGDMGYKKLSRYYSEQLPEGKSCLTGTPCVKVQGMANGHSLDTDSVGMVIVRDIVSKVVIAQFKAHKSPISSLCFDPSGVLLVTASVQGHNINVFRIMPGLSEETGDILEPSYAHLYKLQRGITNAVIRDISFSSDSGWIMISSSRGTSHLFAISPSGGPVNSPSNDTCSHTRSSGSSLMPETSVHTSPNSGLQVLKQQRICASSSPVTLSAVSRIRNGGNGWKNTVSGAAAAATGRLNSISGAIASAFYNGKANDVYRNFSSQKKHYLLVFSQSGSVTQHALRVLPSFNGTMAGEIADFEFNLNHDVGIRVEAIQKWNICQKLNRKERGHNADMYGENGNADNGKVYPERTNNRHVVFSDFLGGSSKEKITTEERHHMYISGAELQMHQTTGLLWMQSEIYFHCMLADGFGIKEADTRGGEIEIERIPVRTIEARSKGLVPVFDYIQTTKAQQGSRILGMNRDSKEQVQPQGPDGMDDNEVGSYDSLDSDSDSDSVTKVGIVDDGCGCGDGVAGFVDNSNDDTPTVESAKTVNSNNSETQHNSVQTDNRDGLELEMEKLFAEDDEFG